MNSILGKMRDAIMHRDIIFYLREVYSCKVGAFQVLILQWLYLGRLSIAKPYKIWGTIRFLIDGPGLIRIGKNFHAVSDRRRSFITLFAPCQLTTIGTGKILIDENVGLNGTCISAKDSVSIGKRVMVAPNTIIMDWDGHAAWPPGDRWQGGGGVKPVIIEDDVWIGMNCIILKGVRIGKGAIIGPNSVVLKDVESGCLYSGNPAVRIKSYER